MLLQVNHNQPELVFQRDAHGRPCMYCGGELSTGDVVEYQGQHFHYVCLWMCFIPSPPRLCAAFIRGYQPVA